MKYNFEVKTLSITFAELLKWLDERRTLGGEFGKIASFFALHVRLIVEKIPVDELFGIEARHVSDYITANFATGNDYKYPETEEEAEIQRLLGNVQTGAFYLIVEQIQRVAKRTLTEAEAFGLIQILHDLTCEVYAKHYPELEGEEE